MRTKHKFKAIAKPIQKHIKPSLDTRYRFAYRTK